MAVEVVGTDEFEAWFDALEGDDATIVMRVVDLLEEAGVALGSPHSSDIKGSDFTLRELRPRAGRSPLRVFYAFDPRRQAVLLLGGSKASNPDRFYRQALKACKRIWQQYLDEQHKGAK